MYEIQDQRNSTSGWQLAQDLSHLNHPNKQQLIFLRAPKVRPGRVGVHVVRFERGLMINDLHDGPAGISRAHWPGQQTQNRDDVRRCGADARFILQAVEVQLLTAHQSNE
jgi:hypothetical protein